MEQSFKALHDCSIEPRFPETRTLGTSIKKGTNLLETF